MVKGSAFDGSGGDGRKFDELSDLAVRRAFARRITEYLHAKGLNQSDLSRASGLTRNQISQYAQAKALPSEASLHKLARAMRMSADNLLPDRRAFSMEPSITVATSADGKLMRIAIDAWVPVALGAQIVSLVAPHVPSDGE